MISLTQALRLCDLNKDDDPVMLTHVSNVNRHIYGDPYLFSLKQIRHQFDMQKTRVVRILPHFEAYGYEYFGMRFVIDGITPEELHSLYLKCHLL